MQAQPTAEAPTGDYELCVLEGAQQGARSRVPLGLPVTVSDRLDSDIVLRGQGLAGRRLRLTAHASGVQVEVLEGELQLGDLRLAAGEQAMVAPGTPLPLGDTAIALGPLGPLARAAGFAGADTVAPTVAMPADETASEVVEAAADAVVDPVGAAAAPAQPDAPLPADAAWPAQRTPRRWWQGLVVGGGGLAAVSMAVLAFAYTVAPPAPTPAQRAARAQAVLQGAGLSQLVARAQPGGTVQVTGYLETDAQRARAEQLLAQEQLPAQWQVWVNEQVASAVVDVYRVNGITADAQAVGPGSVVVSTREGDVERLEALRGIARRDVPGLAQIEVRNAPPPPAHKPMPVVDDPGKRVASIVPGDPPYVVTADGTRYFEGALLPTGHRIAGIAQHQVLLEKDGDRTPLAF